MEKDARSELVEFLFHNAFYPVLMATRDGRSDNEKTLLKHVQFATYAEIERFRSYKTAEEVFANFKRAISVKSGKSTYAALRALNLPVATDVQNAFESKAHELGVDTCA